MFDFFQQKTGAKRKTILLVFLYLIAVVFIIHLFNIVVNWVLPLFVSGNWVNMLYRGIEPTQLYQSRSSIILSSFILITIGLASLMKYVTLRKGGFYIAHQMGAVLVKPKSIHPLEKTYVNVVEEMAIASNMPVPHIMLLKGTQSINAFAAGYKQHDAAIVVTKGALERLTRDELQAVVAHEFSHIVNGDIRLNTQMAALLQGISFIGMTGEKILWDGKDTSTASRAANPFTLFTGLFLLLFGWFGTLLADMIKAAICQQREYLADASAVQFTRMSQPLANALKKVAGLPDEHIRAKASHHQMSHLFFSNVLNPWVGIFSTHPPILTRIKKLQPNFKGPVEPLPLVSPISYQAMGLTAQRVHQRAEYKKTPPSIQEEISPTQNPTPIPNITELSATLIKLAHDPSSADILMYCLLLADNWQVRTQQLSVLNKALTPCQRITLDTVEQLTYNLSYRNQLKTLEVAITSLRYFSVSKKQAFIKVSNALAHCEHALNDKQTVLHWALADLASLYISKKNKQYQMKVAHARKRFTRIQAWQTLLATLAMYSYPDREEAQTRLNKALLMGQLPHYALSDTLAISDLSECLYQLENLAFGVKHRLIKSIKECMLVDDDINEIEQTFLLAIQARLEMQSIDVI